MNATTTRQRSIQEVAAERLAKLRATLAPDLEARLRAMARRWRYTDAELREVLDLARSNPDAWARAVALDERREQEFRDAGILKADA